MSLISQFQKTWLSSRTTETWTGVMLRFLPTLHLLLHQLLNTPLLLDMSHFNMTCALTHIFAL
jgi:hypothetical protein